MPKRLGHVPAYRLHKPAGQARVIIDGQHIYLGPFGSAESKEKYARLIAERASAPAVNINASAADSPSINELILRYWHFAETYYTKNGQPTKELGCMRDALRPLRELYGRTPAREFGPRALKAVRQRMVEQNICRNVINRRIGRIKRFFKWAVSEELLSGSALHWDRAGIQSQFGAGGRSQLRRAVLEARAVALLGTR